MISCTAQESSKYNLGFETQKDPLQLADGWIEWGKYEISIDTLAHSGNYAGKINSGESEDGFGSIAYEIPANYKGERIELKGYMKIKNVSDGFAGLLLRVDGNGSTLAFDNMQRRQITGTKDWEQYSITLNYPEDAQRIYVAGILVGKGEAWFDDFVLSIDGKDVQMLKEVEYKPSKAELDKEFIDASRIELTEPSPKQIESLELLGRVWGFLKYHHLEIAKGNYNWDFELFRFLPAYIKTTDKNESKRQLVDRITSLGKLEDCTNCEPTNESAFLKPDLEWIYQQEEDLKSALLDVYKNRSQGKHYYITKAANVGNPEFKNENSYYDMPYPDDGYRLLSLYRYWNMINYFFPYRHLMDENWNTKLAEYIPVFLNAKNELEYELAALQLIAEIQDTHANIYGDMEQLDAWKGINYPPVHVRFIENQLVVTDYYNEEFANRDGLKVGDIISEIQGKPVDEIVAEKTKYYPASNVPTRLRNLSEDILRSNNKELDITLISKDRKPRTQSVTLYPKDSLEIFRWYKKSEGSSYKILDGNIGYVNLQNIKESDVSKIKEEFKGTKGIIVDIRNYPAIFVPFSLGPYFVSQSTPFVKFTQGNIDHPGEFTFTDTLEIPNDGEAYKGKLVVLVNELTQSMAEYTTMALKAGENITVLGSTTAGADGNVSTILLPGGLRTMISGIGVYYPNGEETQRVGIVPDVEVKPTIVGIRNGKDEVLEKAIQLISEE
ncbi:hypothetical protein GCM10011412_28610 [Maribacter cobaltidurans]|nr:hypothetical protein GCM10011412_28610 [Maribacter cobaltidurans]